MNNGNNMYNMNCCCVPIGTCATMNTGIDIRIVNMVCMNNLFNCSTEYDFYEIV